MTRISEKWTDHAERIAVSWQSQVQSNDIVLLLGDVSWATTEQRVRPDLEWLAQLPGRKVMVRGNHDRWWVDIFKVRKRILPDRGFYALQGDSVVLDGVVLCGAQGHITPNDPYYRPDPPYNRYERELKTLQAALASAAKVRQNGQPLIVMMHYPPFTSDAQPTLYSQMIEAQAPAICLYGHLHRPEEWAVAMNGELRGVRYRLLSADFLGMKLQKVFLFEENRA